MPRAGPRLTVLDTHVWIWMMAGDRSKLSDAGIQEIQRAADAGLVRVCSISVWEVAMLEAKGRISFSRPVDDWIRMGLEAPGVRLAPMTPDIAIDSTRLPGEVHGDPADRILMASTRVLNGRLATCDTAIIDYGQTGHLAVLDSRP